LALGGVCGGAAPSEIERLGAAGVDLGLAFQATDDVLAFWGDPAETGKAIGNDLARGKKSLPLVLAVESGLSVESLRNVDLTDVLSQLERVGAGEQAAQFARDHAGQARRAIEATALSATAVGRLMQLIDFSVERSR
jgi:geranylgeranyl pyrophosphate synthase